MPKLFITSNTHFGYKKHFGFNKFLNISLDYFNDVIIPLLEKYTNKDDSFVHLGNVFSNKQSLNVKIINEIQNIFTKIAKITKVYILVGDNDRYGNDNNINTLSVLRNIENVHIIEQTQKINNLLFIPYTKDINLELIKHDNIDYVFFNNNYKDILSIDRLKIYKKLYSGYSPTKKINGNIKNIGSPYQLEPNIIDCGIFVIDTIKNEELFLLNKTSSKMEKIIINSVEDLTKYDKEFFNKNLIDIVIDKNLYDNKEFKIKLSEVNVNDVIIEDNNKIIQISEDELKNINNLFNIDEIILERIENDEQLKTEFNNILNILNEN